MMLLACATSHSSLFANTMPESSSGLHESFPASWFCSTSGLYEPSL